MAGIGNEQGVKKDSRDAAAGEETQQRVDGRLRQFAGEGLGIFRERRFAGRGAFGDGAVRGGVGPAAARPFAGARLCLGRRSSSSTFGLYLPSGGGAKLIAARISWAARRPSAGRRREARRAAASGSATAKIPRAPDALRR